MGCEVTVGGGLHALVGDDGEVVAEFAVVAETAVDEVVMDVEVLEFDGGAAADVAGEEADAEAWVEAESLEEVVNAGVDAACGGAVHAQLQVFEVAFPIEGCFVGVIRVSGVLVELADDGAVGSASEVERGELFAADLEDFLCGVV